MEPQVSMTQVFDKYIYLSSNTGNIKFSFSFAVFLK